MDTVGEICSQEVTCPLVGAKFTEQLEGAVEEERAA